MPTSKLVKSNKYRSVFRYKTNEPHWRAIIRINSSSTWWSPPYNTEREAAIACDKKRIELSKNPVNVLKKMK